MKFYIIISINDLYHHGALSQHYVSIHSGYARNNHDNMMFKYYIDLRYNS